MYLSYFASKEMERESVNRLYSHSLQKRQSALLRAEAELYPSQPPVVRTQRQVEEYVEKVVKTDLERRRRHLLELERQVYHDPCAPDPDPLTASKLKSHVKHMYTDQVTRFRRAQEARLKEYGGPGSSSVTPARPRSASAGGKGGLAEVDANKEREAKWRPVATSPKHKDVFLSSKPPAPRKIAEQPSPGRQQDLQELNEYFERLAKPLRVWPKVEETKRPDRREEGFNLYPKFRKA